MYQSISLSAILRKQGAVFRPLLPLWIGRDYVCCVPITDNHRLEKQTFATFEYTGLHGFSRKTGGEMG